MDELTSALASSFQVTSNSLTTDAPHPKFSELYKNRGRVRGQEERRRKMLELQKQKRFDFVNHVRRLANNDWHDLEEEDGETSSGNETEMDCEITLPKPGRRYRNQLMLSEWLMEVPEDFQEEWLMVACPVGKRALVVASRGTTYSYTKSGFCANKFPSHLPGGNKHQTGSCSMATESTVLDCIFCEANRTFYVLDVMSWNGCPVLDSETDFRFFWMLSKFQELPEVGAQSRINPYKFIPLTSWACQPESLSAAMISQLPYELDGLLFYHKRTHYLFGVTPLVLWLKPYMITEVLGITVHEKYMSNIPSTYTCFGNHVQRVKKDKEEKDNETNIKNSKTKDRKSTIDPMEVIQGDSPLDPS